MVDVPGYDKNQAILIKISAEAQFMKINYRSILANEQYVMKTCSSASRQIWRQALRFSPLWLYTPLLIFLLSFEFFNNFLATKYLKHEITFMRSLTADIEP
jgi:hypothetical protein